MIRHSTTLVGSRSCNEAGKASTGTLMTAGGRASPQLPSQPSPAGNTLEAQVEMPHTSCVFIHTAREHACGVQHSLFLSILTSYIRRRTKLREVAHSTSPQKKARLPARLFAPPAASPQSLKLIQKLWTGGQGKMQGRARDECPAAERHAGLGRASTRHASQAGRVPVCHPPVHIVQ